MKLRYGITLGVTVLALLGFLAWNRPYIPDPARLAEKALSAGTPKDRVQAAVELSMLPKGQETIPHLRRVLAESQDAEVQVAIISALAGFRDPECAPLLFRAMADNPDAAVRQSAYAGLLRVFGGVLPADPVYRAEDAPDQRLAVTTQLRGHYEALAERKAGVGLGFTGDQK